MGPLAEGVKSSSYTNTVGVEGRLDNGGNCDVKLLTQGENELSEAMTLLGEQDDDDSDNDDDDDDDDEKL